MDKPNFPSPHAKQQELFDSSTLQANGPIIPDKIYFKIGEVSDIAGVEPHVLRYWESEIRIIRPQRAVSKQRLYRRVDVENILTIKQLLHEEGYTIAGARKFLADRRKKKRAAQKKKARQLKPREIEKQLYLFCKEMRTGLEEIKTILDK